MKLWAASIPTRLFSKESGGQWEEFKACPWSEVSLNIPEFSDIPYKDDVPEEVQSSVFHGMLQRWIDTRPKCHGVPIITNDKDPATGFKRIQVLDTSREITALCGSTKKTPWT